MVKRFSVIALAGMLTMPMLASANGDSAGVGDLEQRIQELSRQLAELKAIVAEQQSVNEEQEEILDEIDEKSEGWDLASRFTFYGDFRSRLDYYNADLANGTEIDNDTLMTNRLRLNMRVKATENMEFKGRLAMYKTWGSQSGFNDGGNTIWPLFDGNVTRTPAESSALYVDRAFVNWNNIGGLPMWFSVGRRPTTDGPPANFKIGADDRVATPMAFMDWPFDGLSLGYAWNWSNEKLGSSRIRFCYGRGFEAGSQDSSGIEDMDFAGFSWDIMKKDDRFAYIQSFMAFNVINYPNFEDPDENTTMAGMLGPRDNLGKIWHTAAVYQSKVAGLNYFVSGGYSRTMPDSDSLGMFYQTDGMSFMPNHDDEDGYSVYVGVRYDMDDIGLKIGAEYNHGSQYWLAMSPGHDDIYHSKLATRGDAYELYLIYDLPAGEMISKYAKTFIRLGWQHYEYDYMGSGDWNLYPYSIDHPMAAGMGAVESADQIYLTFEAYF